MYTTKQLAEICGISEYMIRNYRNNQIIEPAQRKGLRNYYDDSAIAKIKAFRADMKQNKPIKNTVAPDCTGTICWQCIHTYGTACSWMAAHIPVDGWTATKVFMYNGRVVSYKVKSCPNFEKELFEVGKDGIKRRINTVPEMRKVRAIDILDLYHRSKKFI